MMGIDDYENCKKYLIEFMDDYLNFLLDRAQKEIDYLIKAERVAEQEHLASAIEVAKLEWHIRTLSEGIEKRSESFEDDFDQILAMEGVQKIGIDNNVLLIYTKRLDQIVHGKPYDIGQSVIRIDFGYWWAAGAPNKNLPRSYIRFRRGAYMGEYRHTFAHEETMVCFGNHLESGLNSAIDNLYLNTDVVRLVHLLLSFLRLESSREPTRREVASEKYDPSLDKGWDASEEEKAATQREFIELLKRVTFQSGKENIEEALKKTRRDHDRKAEMLFTARAKVRSALETKKSVFKKEGSLDEIIQRETDSLSRNERINEILYLEKYLLIDALDKDNNITIRISMSEPPLIFCQPQIQKRFLWTIDDKGRLVSLSREKTQRIAEYLAEFRIAELVYTLLSHLLSSDNNPKETSYAI